MGSFAIPAFMRRSSILTFGRRRRRGFAAGKSRAAGNVKGATPLTGKIFADGEPLTPTHAKNHGRRYRYYVSRSLVDFGASDAKGWRLPAAEIEAAVADLIRRWLKECAGAKDRRSGGNKRSIDAVRSAESAIAQAIDDAECKSNLALLNTWRTAIREILLDNSSIALKLDPAALPTDLGGLEWRAANEAADTNECGGESDRAEQLGDDASDLIIIERPIRFARRGVGRKLILDDARINPDSGDNRSHPHGPAMARGDLFKRRGDQGSRSARRDRSGRCQPLPAARFPPARSHPRHPRRKLASVAHR